MNAAGSTLATAPGLKTSRPIIFMQAAAACASFAFAFWTLSTHLTMMSHLSFHTLALIGPLAIAAGIVCGLFYVAVRNNIRSPQHDSPVSSLRVGWTWIAFAAALVSARGLGLGYSGFWILSVIFLFTGLVKAHTVFGGFAEQASAVTGRQAFILLFLILVCSLITYIAHRPDVDDAVYVGTAADAISHPELPVLSHDVLYGNQQLPLMLPSYAAESYELFIAMLAYWLGVQPIFLAHAILPTLLAMLVPIAWATLMRILAPKHWLAATVLALVVLSLPADARGFGNFAFVRLFQGKAIFVSIGIPLLYAYAWRFDETGSAWDGLTVAGCVIACVGLSSSAIFVVPMALVTATLAGWRPGFSERAAWTLLPAIYPLACGIWISRGFNGLSTVFAHLPARAELGATMVFGTHAQFLIFFALLAAPFLQRNIGWRWCLGVMVLLYFLGPLDPFTFKFLAKLATRDAVWRVLWCVPVAGIVATAFVSAVREARDKWGSIGAATTGLALAGTLAYLVPYSSFALSNGVSYSLKPLKVVDSDYEIAREAIAETPQNESILAPEKVAVWIPTFIDRRSLVSVREIYDEEMGVHMTAVEARERRELRELVSGRQFSPERRDQLLDSLSRYSVGMIVVNAAASNELAAALSQHGYSHLRTAGEYALFRLG